MKSSFTRLFAVLLLTCSAGLAHATQFPPGPAGNCGGASGSDSLTVFNIQNTSATCHAATGDTVLGVGGVITGFDKIPTGFGFYIQNNRAGANGSPWTGVDVFTGGSNFAPVYGLGLGDSVVVEYTGIAEFASGTELLSPNNSFTIPNIVVRRVGAVSVAHPVPAFHVGTVAELQQLSSNPTAEQWEGTLVKINGPMRVVRTSLDANGVTLGGLGTSNTYLVVDDVACTGGTCDTLMIDGNTLTNHAPPAVGSSVTFVQGIYEERTGGTYKPAGGNGYKIQLRSANDVGDQTAPTVLDAWPIFDNNGAGGTGGRTDSILVTFDRSMEKTTTEDVLNYTAASGGVVTNVHRLDPPDDDKAVVTLVGGFNDGGNESLTIGGSPNGNPKSAATGVAMTSQQSRSFYEGVMAISQVQAAQLSGGNVICPDRSAFAGTGSAVGQRLSVRGVVTKAFGNIYYLEDAAGGTRSGMSQFATVAPLNEQHSYIIAGGVQEFFEETEGSNNVYVRDEGAAAVPAPVVKTSAVLSDTTCSLAPPDNNGGEALEGTLVKMNSVRVVPFPGDGVNPSSREPACGASFFVIDYPGHVGATSTDPQAIEIHTTGTTPTITFCADTMQVLNVTGIQRFPFGTFQVYPRNDADIQLVGTLGVHGSIPRELSFSVYPNPAHNPTMSFALPKAGHVDVGVYDLAGRKIVAVVNEQFTAGSYSRRWDGRDSQGNSVGAGMYFIKMRFGSEMRLVRSVRLN